MPYAFARPSAHPPLQILLPEITASGFTTFTRILSFPNSAAFNRDKCNWADFAEPYAALLGPLTSAFLLTIFNTSPPKPCLRIMLTACCVTRNCPFTNTSYRMSQSCSLCSSSGLEIERPALLTIISIPPNDNAAIVSVFCIVSALVTSSTPASNASLPYCLLNSSFASCNRSELLSERITQAPSSANFLAIALPIPPALPVTIAILPDKAFGFGIRCSFASSSNQYSILNASCLGNDVYSDI